MCNFAEPLRARRSVRPPWSRLLWQWRSSPCNMLLPREAATAAGCREQFGACGSVACRRATAGKIATGVRPRSPGRPPAERFWPCQPAEYRAPLARQPTRLRTRSDTSPFLRLSSGNSGRWQRRTTYSRGGYRTDLGRGLGVTRRQWHNGSVGSHGAARGTGFAGTDRFSIVRMLGRGGTSSVYEAFDRHYGHVVALKTLRRPGSESLFRLKREFRGLRELKHPNLVSLYDLFADVDPIFFSMEYVAGPDLLAYVRAPLPDRSDDAAPHVRLLACQQDKLRQVLPQLAAGIAALHAAGKLHRDIKPSNAHVTPDGIVKILDFGLAVDIGGAELEPIAGQVSGTVGYMSPEQAAQDPQLGPATDWYSFGVMLYEALTGRLPHLGPPLQVLLEKTREPPPPVRQLVPDVPDDLEYLVRGLLERDPGKRMRGHEVLERLGLHEPGRRRRTATPVAGDVIPFQGRAAELEALSAAFASVRARRSAQTVVVSGPSGMGKSALIAEFLRRVKESHPTTLVLRGRCYEWESVSHKAMDAVIDDLSSCWRKLPEAAAARLLPRNAQLLQVLFPVLGRVPAVAGAPSPNLRLDPQARRTRAYGALRETFELLTEEAPAIVVIDDMQWTDADSITLLAELLRGDETPALLVVIGARSHALDEGSRLATLLHGLGKSAQVLPVPPLSEDEARALADLALNSPDASRSEAIVDDAGGSPFFVTELACHERPGVGRGAAIRTVDELVAVRADAQAPAARALLDVLAVAGEPIEQGVAAVAARLDPASFSSVLRGLRGDRLARLTPGREDDQIECYHDRIRKAVLARLEDARRQAVYAALAAALEARGLASSERLAHHFRGAGQLGKAASYAERGAGEAERVMDFARASELYAMAISLGNHDDRERLRLLIAQADALANAGQPARAADVWERALALTSDAGESLDLRARIVAQLVLAGEYQRGIAAARAVARAAQLAFPLSSVGIFASLATNAVALRIGGTAPRPLPDGTRARLIARKLDVSLLLLRGLGLVDPLRSFVFTQQAARLAPCVADPERRAMAFSAMAAVAVASGSTAAYRRYASAADHVAAQAESAVANMYAAAPRMLHAYFVLNDWAAARVHIERARRWLQDARQGAGFEAWTLTVFECGALAFQGEFASLWDIVPRMIAEASRAGNCYLEVALRTSSMAILKQAADDPEGALAEISDSLAQWVSTDHAFTAPHMYGMLRAVDSALYVHRPDAARTHIAADEGHLRRSLFLRVPFFAADHAFALAKTDLAAAAAQPLAARRAALRRRAVHRARHLARMPLPLAQAWSQVLRAGAAQLAGDGDSAIAYLRTAVEQLEQTGTRPHAEAARRQLGVALGGDAGAALVSQADSWMADAGVRRPDRFTAMLVPGWS
jgi:eukaryotic-like serine/threonine-protein kinase